MLIAFGNIDMNPLIDGLLAMAKNQTIIHEHNQRKNKESWNHPDGWGIAYLQEGRWIIEKSSLPIFKDPKINKFRDLKSTLVILHARKKTVNSGITESNCHPFRAKQNGREFVFCHNGTIRSEISFDPDFKTEGETDSEKLFYSILTDLKQIELNPETISQAIINNMKQYEIAHGSNIIMSSKDKSFIYLMKNDFPAYYTMQLGKKEGFLVISSEKLANLDISWQPLESEKVLVVDNQSLNHKSLGF